MNLRSSIRLSLVASMLVAGLPAMAAEEAAAPNGASKSSSEKAATLTAEDVAQLKALILAQQHQIDQLREALEEQGKKIDAQAFALPKTKGLGEVASASPIIPSGSSTTGTLLSTPGQAQPTTGSPDKRVDNLVKGFASLAGFQFGGDFRLRSDTIWRSANSFGGPVQNARGRYRLRLNIDRPFLYKEASDHPMFRFHLQLTTGPSNNPLTNDADFAGVDIRPTIAISEAWVDFLPFKNVTLRGGRSTEIFADGTQFVYDDDIRFNGFSETIRIGGSKLYADLKAGQYILTNPNVQIVPAGSPFLAAGYRLGQRISSADLLDQGVTVGGAWGKGFTASVTGNYSYVRNPNQIQLATTANGFPALLPGGTIGVVLTGGLPQAGNATTTAGGAIYNASGFRVFRGALTLGYSGWKTGRQGLPFTFYIQGTHNKSANDLEANGFSAGLSLGETKKLGDLRFGYKYFRKEANAFISQLSDDDVGTGVGVNLETHALQIDLGLTRFLSWQNRLYIQDELAANDPARNFFVPQQKGTNTQYRFQSQFLFTF